MNLLNKKSVFLGKVSNRVSSIIGGIEIFLACLLIFSVIIAGVYLIIDFVKEPSQIHQLLEYDNFQQLLSYILLLIIALELSIMLIRHNPNNVIEVMIYAIARKMLIYNTSSMEMLLGVITLVILIVIKIYLIKDHHFNQDNLHAQPDHSGDTGK